MSRARPGCRSRYGPRLLEAALRRFPLMAAKLPSFDDADRVALDRPDDQSRDGSRASCPTLTRKRSQIAFALGARRSVWKTLMPTPSATMSNRGPYLLSRSRRRKRGDSRGHVSTGRDHARWRRLKVGCTAAASIASWLIVRVTKSALTGDLANSIAVTQRANDC